jgi:catechol 2,3-dioxygenase
MSKKPALSFSHIGLHVTDPERMAAFYTRVLGFTVTDRGALGPVKLVFLSRVPEDHHQIVLATGRPADLSFNTVNQISFRMPALRDLRKIHRAIVSDPHVSDIQPVTHGNAWSVYCRDPEGNRLEFFVDTPWHSRQPFRVPIDFTLSDAEISKRTEALIRAEPDFMPRRKWLALMAQRMGLARPQSRKKMPKKKSARVKR